LTRILFPFREEVRVGIFPSLNFYFLMGLRSSEKIVERSEIRIIKDDTDFTILESLLCLLVNLANRYNFVVSVG
jgi:hypothetical protein